MITALCVGSATTGICVPDVGASAPPLTEVANEHQTVICLVRFMDWHFLGSNQTQIVCLAPAVHRRRHPIRRRPMKVLNQAETALVISDLLRGTSEIEYARADDHEGKERIYMTVRVTDSLKAFAHLFDGPDSSGVRKSET
jgi:hypothetical protein